MKPEMKKCQGACGKNRNAAKFYKTPQARVCITCQKKTAARNARNSRILKTYGITEAEYEAILEAQGGVCAGCGEKRPYNLAVDHDHEIEKTEGVRASLRGLLCRRCNKILRDVRDNATTLRRLGDYAEDPPAQKVLNPSGRSKPTEALDKI